MSSLHLEMIDLILQLLNKVAKTFYARYCLPELSEVKSFVTMPLCLFNKISLSFLLQARFDIVILINIKNKHYIIMCNLLTPHNTSCCLQGLLEDSVKFPA